MGTPRGSGTARGAGSRPDRRRGRPAVRVAVALLAAAVLMAALWGLQRRLIHFPGPPPGDPPAGVEQVRAATGDGVELEGWWLDVDDPAGPSVIVFHGNGGTHADRLPLARALADHGLPVLLAGYRGYGGNPGSPSEDGLEADALAWHDWLAAHGPGGGTAYLGESLGAGVAARLAVTRPPAALVLRSPFTSLADVGAGHYPWLPVRRLLRDDYPVAALVAQVEAPVTVVLGTGDRIVPPAMSRAVHAAAADPAALVEVPGADHNDRALLSGPELIGAVVAVLVDGG